MEKIISKIRNIVITGANKGIGFGIIDRILSNQNFKPDNQNILLCTRNLDNGTKAIEQLTNKHKEKVKAIKVVELDITNEDSQTKFIELIVKDFEGRIDCLINNAGVSVSGPEFNLRVFDYTFNTNFYATKTFTEKILKEKLIKEKGKIIFIGSSVGKLSKLKSNDLASRFTDKDLTSEKIVKLSQEFRLAIENGTWEKDGWPQSVYSVSKICLNKYAYVLGHSKEILEKEIQVYSCCPGWVRTDMGGKNAYRSLEEGSVTPVYLIDLVYELNKEYQGRFFYDEKVDSIDTYEFKK